MLDHKGILKRLTLGGHCAFLIGGAVRDSILGKKPKDYDIVTSARPSEIKLLFGDHDIHEVGNVFPSLKINGIDITTYRRYAKDESGDVEYADSLLEDTERRDLTINAMAMDIDGGVKDFHNGLKDLERGIIRFIGDPEERIKEDPCRIIRACRFLALLQGKFDYETYCALQNYSHLLKSVSKERIRDEILYVIKTVEAASSFFVALVAIKALQFVSVSLSQCIGVSQNRFHEEMVFHHNMMTGDGIPCKFPLLKLAGYLHDVGKPFVKSYSTKNGDYTFLKHETIGTAIAEEELTYLKFPEAHINYIASLIRLHMFSSPKTPKAFRKLLQKINESHKDFVPYKKLYNDHLRLKFADGCGKVPPTKPTRKTMIELVSGFHNVLKGKEPTALSMLAINGTHVMMYLKLKPGPLVGKILRHLLEMVMEVPEMNNIECLYEYMSTLKVDSQGILIRIDKENINV